METIKLYQITETEVHDYIEITIWLSMKELD